MLHSETFSQSRAKSERSETREEYIYTYIITRRDYRFGSTPLNSAKFITYDYLLFRERINFGCFFRSNLLQLRFILSCSAIGGYSFIVIRSFSPISQVLVLFFRIINIIFSINHSADINKNCYETKAVPLFVFDRHFCNLLTSSFSYRTADKKLETILIQALNLYNFLHDISIQYYKKIFFVA